MKEITQGRNGIGKKTTQENTHGKITQGRLHITYYRTKLQHVEEIIPTRNYTRMKLHMKDITRGRKLKCKI